MSAVKMRAGKSTSMNYWLRARVVLQGVTLVALVAGSMVLQRKKNTEIPIGAAERGEDTELSREKKIFERQAFEERLKFAEMASEQEQMLTVKGPSVNKERREDDGKKRQASAQTEASQSPVLKEAKKDAGWSWWSSGKNSDPQVKDNNSDSM